MTTFVEWLLYAGAWEFLFRKGCGMPTPDRLAAVELIQEYD